MLAVRLVWVAAPAWTVLSGALALLQSLLPLTVLYLTKLTLDAVTSALQSPHSGYSAGITWYVVFAATAGWANYAMRSLLTYANEVQGEQVSEYVQDLIAKKAVQVDLAYYENAAYHDTLHHAQIEAPQRPTRIVAALMQITQSALSLLGIGGLVLLSFHWTTVLLVAVIAGLGMVARVRNVRLLYRWRQGTAGDERRLSYFSWLLNAAGAAKEIRLYQLGSFFGARTSGLRRTLRQARVRISAQRTIGEMLAQLCASAGVGYAFYYLVRRTLEHVLTIGDLVMNLQALQRAAALVQDLVAGFSQLYEHGLFINRFHEFMSLQQRVKDPESPCPFPVPLTGPIRFENVGFRYPNAERPVLEQFNMVIEPGQMIALVGENGAGKSTLVKLLSRLYDPTEGRITIGGVDLRAFAREDLWRHVAVLFQDFPQYQATAAENIQFGAAWKDHLPQEVSSAARLGGAEDFVTQLPGGYQQMLGNLFEGGMEISGGQWQKIALSRAFYRDAPILILDEPTSALDVKSEHDVFERFKSLTKGKTSFVISHRLSTVRMADKIYHLENGEIIEAGSHADLLTLGGSYSELFETQAVNYR